MTRFKRDAGHERGGKSALRRRMPAQPDAVTEMRRAVVDLAKAHGADERMLGDIRLAVSEAVANVVMHAYEDGEEGCVECRARYDDGVLEVIISDEGHGIRTKPSTGQGLGLGLVARVTSDFSIGRRPPRGTEVRMCFVLGVRA